METLKIRQLVNKATEDNEGPTAGYMYNEITSASLPAAFQHNRRRMAVARSIGFCWRVGELVWNGMSWKGMDSRARHAAHPFPFPGAFKQSTQQPGDHPRRAVQLVDGA